MLLQDFVRNERESSAQKSIYHCLCMLASFRETTVTFHDGITVEDYIEGERQFYQYVMSLYFDMYADPLTFAIDSSRYDEYMRNRHRLNKGKLLIEKQHYQDAKESSLRNVFQQSITFYFRFLYELGQCAQLCQETYALKLSADSFEKVVKNAGTAKIAGKEHQRVRILLDNGINQSEQGSQLVFIHEKYPKMFLGLAVLCRAPDSKYKWMNYLRLDYKRFHSPMPDMPDIIETVPGQAAQNIAMLTETLKAMPLKIRVKPLRNINSDFKWKAEFTYKGKSCIGFYVDCDSLLICVYFNNAANITDMAGRLLAEDPELFEWFCAHIPERLCKCPNNRWVTLGEQRRRICGMSNRMDVANPLDSDMERCVKIIKMFRGI